MQKTKKKPVKKILKSAVLTLDEAAAYLRIAPSALLVEAEAGRVPGLCFAGEWRFTTSALETALSTNRRSPSEPTMAQSRYVTSEQSMSPEEIAYWASRRPPAGVGKDYGEDPEEFIAEMYRQRQQYQVGD
jgi:hypothetical protein